jgi:hypothetical protein
MKNLRKLSSYIVLVVFAVVFVVVWNQRNAIGDWAVLQGYTPSSDIAALADRTTMTPLAKKYLYVNKPQLDDRSAFNKHCTNDREQSVVLGCFLGNRNGIYIFNVTTTELEGVREVTTAHEMLHQAYDRLSNTERSRINGLLQDYYRNDLASDAIKSQIELYKKSEPDALPNEMHSLFGTQVGALPAELEQYYAQYFTDRAKVVAYYTNYQRAFTERKEKIAAFDAQLSDDKQRIDQLEKDLEQQRAHLDDTRDAMDQKRSSGQIDAYNNMVTPYNTAIRTYNNGVEELQRLIARYNTTVNDRNAIADQEHALQQSLSSKELPSAAGE